jgi:ribose transport system substrate-binding protein
MRTRLSLVKGLVALVFVAALTGCKDSGQQTNGGTTPPAPNSTSPAQTTSAGDKPTFKVITNGISPFWDSMGKGLEAAKKEVPVSDKTDWQAPSAPYDNNAQVKVFKDAIAQKVDGIAVSVIEAKALAPTIDEAIDAGIPVITFDSDSEGSKRLVYLGTNNFEAGKAAGTAALKLFPNGGKLVAFVGNMSAQNARDRYNGFKEALKGSKVEFIAEPFEDNKDKGKARKNVEDAITRYQGQGLNGLVGLYSYNGPAIVGAVKAANLIGKVKIICFDGEPETLKNLDQGLVDVTVVQKPYEFGRLSVKLLYLIKKDGGIDKAMEEMKPELEAQGMKVDMAKHNIDTGVDVITPANAKPFLQKLKEKGLEST